MNGNEWSVFTLTPEGMAWLHANEDKIEKAPHRRKNRLLVLINLMKTFRFELIALNGKAS